MVIPTLDAAAVLPGCLAALAEGRAAGLVGEVIVVDGGSRDGTAAAVVAGGARLLSAPPGRGNQLAVGASTAGGEWLLFLHADTRLAPGWAAAAAAFIAEPGASGRAGYFRLAFDEDAAAARRLEWMVERRCRVFALPYGDQGLLVASALYKALGGFRALPIMEDVDLVRRLGRRRLAPLAAVAVTSAERYRRGGWLARPLRNLACLGLYFAGLPPRLIRRLYA